MSSQNLAQQYPKLTELLQEVQALHDGTVSKAETLMSVLTKKHYWPYLQIKYFSSQSSLILLHNIYKQDLPISNKELYDECRSVVLDMNAPEESQIVLSLSKKIPIRMSVERFEEVPFESIKMMEVGYEGTMMYIYHHQDRWHISTSTCPSVDRSRYFNPHKSHGQMLDEALHKIFPGTMVPEESRYENSKRIRAKFFEQLDPTKSYSFLLIHHENGHLMNYTELFGENYAVLFHLNTRDRQTQEDSKEVVPQLKELGIWYTEKFPSRPVALYTLQNVTPPMYAIMAHTDTDIYKVSTKELLEKEELNLGHPNPWMNLLWIYMQNKPHLRMEYYLDTHPDLKEKMVVQDSKGTLLAPQKVVAKVMTSMRDILYNFYRATTYYYKNTNTYRMNREYDQQLAPILRFHLAQLRHLQITYHTTEPLTRQAVHHYLCHHQTIKNIRLLMDAFTNQSMTPMDQYTADCFYILNQALKNKL